MTERSWPWPGTTVGDAGPYSDDEWDDMYEMRFGSGVAPFNNRGVIRDWANELEVTDGGVNQADVDTGAALVHGKHYDNDAVVNVAIPNAVGAWREDLICLQADWVTQTIRIARHANPADVVAYPAPTQTDGVTWEIPLAAVRIDNAGVITLVTDLRVWASDLLHVKMIQSDPVPFNGAAWVNTGDHRVVELDADNEQAIFEFYVPLDFVAIRRAVVWIRNNAAGAWTYTVRMDGAECDGAQAALTDSDTGAGTVSGNVICMDVSAALTPMAGGYLIGLEFEATVAPLIGAIYVYKFVLEYV